MVEKVKDIKVKLHEPKEEEDVQLPEVVPWNGVANRPRNLGDLDSTAEALLASNNATILTLGDIAYLDSITTTEITDNAITTPKILAGAVSASKISVGDLSAINADLGSITAGDITGVTITGGTVRTASSGSRVEMSGSNNRFEVYSGSTLRISIEDDEITYRNSVGTQVGRMYSATTNLFIAGDNNMDISAVNVLYLSGQGASITLSSFGIDMSDDVVFNNNNLEDCGNILANDTTSDIGTASVQFDNLYIDDIHCDNDINIDDGVLNIQAGFVKLANMSGATADARTDDLVDGNMYYRTDDDTIRVRLNGAWKTITTS